MTDITTVQGGVSDLLKRTWWIYLIGGIASLFFGVIAFFKPGAALFVLGVCFAVFLLLDGIFSIFGVASRRHYKGWWWLLLYGILASVIGIFLLLSPPASMLALVYTIAFFAMIAGLTQIFLGIELRKEIKGEWILYVSGVLSVLLALLIILRIGFGSLVVIYMIAVWAVLVGVLRIALALRVRSFLKFIAS